MNVFVMQSLEFTWNIGEIGIENGIAFRLPPKPILHDRIERNMLFAIAVSNSKDLLLGNITVLRLEEAVSPFGKHGRVASQVAILVDNLVHLRAIDQVIVDRVRRQRAELERQRKPVVRIRK